MKEFFSHLLPEGLLSGYNMFLDPRRNFLRMFFALGMLMIMGMSLSYSQDSTNKVTAESRNIKNRVYRIRPLVNGTIIVGGLITNYFGVKILRHKKGVPVETVMNLSPADVNAFDRGASKQNPADAKWALQWSDNSLYMSTLLPGLLLFDKHIKKDALNVLVVYLTTMSVMSNAYSWGVGHINKYRPYVYNTQESIARRTRNGSKNSFYAGHVAATACATYFLAKVYHDYHPGSKLSPYLFAAAAIPPAIVGYFRYKSGMHFPTDIIAGFAAGTMIGIVVPQIHKIKHKNLSFYPGYGGGLAMTYKF